jgi:ATP-binding cassette subfamily F protein uup
MSENIISIENLKKEFPDKLIVDTVSFGIHENEKIGLVGVNGCGKTTLLKMLADEEPLDEGKITFRNDIKIGYLRQKPILNPDNTILEEVFESNDEKLILLKEYSRILFELETKQSSKLLEKQQEIYDRIEHLGAWEIEIKARQYLSLLGLTNLNRTIENLSGGEKRRVDMARVLMSDPNLIILDEPTNHLDIDSIEWLQDFLRDIKATVIFVTHDRYFLDEVCSRIIDIDNGILRSYHGNYSYYLEKKELELVDSQRKETRRQAQLKKELKWLNRGARARSSKPKNHLDRVKELLDKSYLQPDKEMEISFQMHRLGKTILESHNLTKQYDKILFNNFSHLFQKGERIGIIGDNGSGKTTLLRMLIGDEEADSGSVKVGVNTKFAYFKQEEEEYEQNISVIEYINQYAPNIRTKDGVLHSSSEMLQRFLFDGKMQQSRVSSLSGGEKRRLFLLKSLLFGSNFLILDEPTNDLDIKTLEILEDYLDVYQGCLLIVSHDRYFLDRTIDTLFIIEDGKIIKFPGNYSDFLLVKKYRKEEKEDKIKKQEIYKQEKNKKTKKMSYKDKLELELVETDIEKIEMRQLELQEELINDASTLNVQDFARISQELENLETELVEKMERWEELESLK